MLAVKKVHTGWLVHRVGDTEHSHYKHRSGANQLVKLYELGIFLDPIIYDYIPGATVVLDAHGDYWHLEDFKRVKHLDSLIGSEFDSFDEMMAKCNDWR